MQQVSLLAFNPNGRRVRVRGGTCGGQVGGGGQGRGRGGPEERGEGPLRRRGANLTAEAHLTVDQEPLIFRNWLILYEEK